MDLSSSARDKLQSMENEHAKDLFGNIVVFEQALEGCRAQQEAGICEIPSFVSERSDLEEIVTSANSRYFLLTPKGKPGKHEYCVIYIHGGGFMLEIGEPHWEFCVTLTEDLDCEVVVPIYPLVPTGNYRDAFKYMVDVYVDVLHNCPAPKMFFMGDSAGGYLTVALAQLARENGLPQPAGLIPLSPMLDLSDAHREEELAAEPDDPMLGLAGIDKICEYWCDGDDPKEWPPNVARGPLDGLAPMHIFMGSREILLPAAKAFVKRAEAENASVTMTIADGMWHCYAMMLEMDEGRAAYEQIKEIMKTNTKGA